MGKIYEAQQVVERIAAFHQHYVTRSNILANTILRDSLRCVVGHFETVVID